MTMQALPVGADCGALAMALMNGWQQTGLPGGCLHALKSSGFVLIPGS